ncbi:VOC family protein [Rhodovulum sp. 12E13]|uniref:VOC family protein n=1 Tax=Rhodovulum sp. 12E13 TaxID=2203891 RepID=UPI001313EC82|nr:VOC family protein [Rhodovulum sp. 12E13]
MKSLDHFVHMVRDLETARQTWSRLGFHVRPAARHIEFGSSNAVVIFERTYNELLWLEHCTAPALVDPYMPRLTAGEGLAHVSLTADSLAAERQRLEGLGHAVGVEGNARRAVTMPDGRDDETDSSFLYNWQPARPFNSLFFSEHRKPDQIFIPGYVDHANGARDVTRLVWLSADPGSDLGYFRDSWGQEPESVGEDGFVFRGARGDLSEVLTSHAVRARYGALAGAADPGTVGGYPVAMHFRVSDPDATRGFLAGAGVEVADLEHGIGVAAADACGAVLVFEPLSA